MKKYRVCMLCIALLFLPTVSSAADVPTYTVSTVYEAPEGARIEQLVVRNDTLYVVRNDNSTLIRVLPDGTGTVFAGGATSPSLLVAAFLPDGPLVATEVAMGVLGNVAIDSKGNLYVQIGSNTWRISPEGQLTRFAGKKAFTLPFAALDGMGGPALDATIAQPGGRGGAAIDGADNVFLRTSTAKPYIVKVDTTGLATLYAGNGERGNDGDGGPATAAQLYGLGEIAADAAGNLYLAEADRGLRKIATDGTITTIVSKRDATTALKRNEVVDNIAPLSTRFEDILHVAAGPDGSVFFVTSASSIVYQLTPDGHVSTIAGTGEEGFGGDGGPARAALFQNIFGIATDASGNVYVSDRDNLRIRKLTRDTPLQAGGGGTGGGQTGGGGTGGGQTGGGDTGGGDTGTGDTTTPSVELPTGDRGPIALDLDETAGDQAKVQTDANPASGDKVVIDVVAVSGANGQIGFQILLAYDAAQLQFDSFAGKDTKATGIQVSHSDHAAFCSVFSFKSM